jgi:hypothetical protein
MSDQESGMGRSWTRAEDRMAIRHRNIRVCDFYFYYYYTHLVKNGARSRMVLSTVFVLNLEIGDFRHRFRFRIWNLASNLLVVSRGIQVLICHVSYIAYPMSVSLLYCMQY